MTRDEIISMFHEAGKAAGWKPGVGNKLVINYLTHLAALVAAAEREACAQVCDDTQQHCSTLAARSMLMEATVAIRARSQA